MDNIKLAIIGATGLIGSKIIELIEEKKLKYSLIFVASKNSKNCSLKYNKKVYNIIAIEDVLDIEKDINFAIFVAGASISQKWIPIFIKKGITIIDNSSYYRMNPAVKLIVPEVNGNLLKPDDVLIANPNCSTIQLVLALKPIHNKYKVKRIIVSTYQAVSGSGREGLRQLYNERKYGITHNISINSHNDKNPFKHKIDLNIIPQIDQFLNNGYTKEEMKIINETKKILNDNSIKITVTAVRVPIPNVHCESIYLELGENYKINDIIDLLNNSKGIEVMSDDMNFEYPMPINTNNTDIVKIGRIRQDLDNSKALNLWISADNIRVGAATNALQILSILLI